MDQSYSKEIEETIEKIEKINKKENTQYVLVDRRDMQSEEKENFKFITSCSLCHFKTKCQVCCALFYCAHETHCIRCNEFLFNYNIKATEVIYECVLCNQKSYYCGDKKMLYHVCRNKKCRCLICDSCSSHYIDLCPFCRCNTLECYDGDEEEVRKAVEEKTGTNIFFNTDSTIAKERMLGKKRIRTLTKEELEEIKIAEKAYTDQARETERRDEIEAIRRVTQEIEGNIPRIDMPISELEFAAIEEYMRIGRQEEEEEEEESEYEPNSRTQMRTRTRRRRNR